MGESDSKIGHPNRHLAYKNKKSACGLCKPHKRGWSRRFDERTAQKLQILRKS